MRSSRAEHQRLVLEQPAGPGLDAGVLALGRPERDERLGSALVVGDAGLDGADALAAAVEVEGDEAFLFARGQRPGTAQLIRDRLQLDVGVEDLVEALVVGVVADADLLGVQVDAGVGPAAVGGVGVVRHLAGLVVAGQVERDPAREAIDAAVDGDRAVDVAELVLGDLDPGCRRSSEPSMSTSTSPGWRCASAMWWPAASLP